MSWLENIANEQSKYRENVDLLWFPTGGGKTEAYLGLTAFTLFLRRIKNPLDSGTGVITLKNKVNISHTILQEVAEDYKPTYLSVIKLSDNDMRIIKENFIRAKKNNDFKTILLLKEKIIGVIDEEPHKDVTAENFIKCILKDYNHFTKNM